MDEIQDEVKSLPPLGRVVPLLGEVATNETPSGVFVLHGECRSLATLTDGNRVAV